MLPPVPHPDPDLLRRLRALGVTPAFVLENRLHPDTLFAPLRLSRAAQLNDEPPYALLRSVFCRADFHVRYVRGLLLWSDYLRDDESDVVMGAGETTAVLFNAARQYLPARTVLDVGCGAGTLALLGAATAEYVTATDINARAIELTRFNAAQNGIVNIDARQGDLFEPVQGARFDLIVSQPPYYPGITGPLFLQGGVEGTEIAARLLDGIAAHLATGGTAVIHTSIPLHAATPTLDGLKTVEYTPGVGEVAGTRHSVLVLQHGSGSARLDIPPATWGRWPI